MRATPSSFTPRQGFNSSADVIDIATRLRAKTHAMIQEAVATAENLAKLRAESQAAATRQIAENKTTDAASVTPALTDAVTTKPNPVVPEPQIPKYIDEFYAKLISLPPLMQEHTDEAGNTETIEDWRRTVLNFTRLYLDPKGERAYKRITDQLLVLKWSMKLLKELDVVTTRPASAEEIELAAAIAAAKEQGLPVPKEPKLPGKVVTTAEGEQVMILTDSYRPELQQGVTDAMMSLVFADHHMKDWMIKSFFESEKAEDERAFQM
ncbi:MULTISPECIES: hypothetical protein [unclassified Undibacterium]|uniref:hypothetical protein n=1 Tax=unclassified Undibacterium TaxID=2630295 RepID=UPI002AC9E94F|nr:MULTISPECIES: hypothetical protein [unclassified Undibacterium]MEB0140403.1 hypothetical protein [Undibacterium sp. CCC2.1]MEB0173437.1 hypothetical protein [Undibacterium sp. CCC1.1]MEB0177337.1 hypothetical protein [Undibacterium sp. CCC3.4]MEB0216595.1 hypothetical protein [Undibacterium sp. 5I2]WPX43496.1 hypothetical protein RHM61_19325 [Undibacterium sp. CCC3.4]